MSKACKICYAAIGAALYFVASCSLKIPPVWAHHR